jgi:hypothetical protein
LTNADGIKETPNPVTLGQRSVAESVRERQDPVAFRKNSNIPCFPRDKSHGKQGLR